MYNKLRVYGGCGARRKAGRRFAVDKCMGVCIEHYDSSELIRLRLGKTATQDPA